MLIDWKKVAKEYSGIEICPYIGEQRLKFSWYYPWDVASGCVWDNSAVKSINLVSGPNKIDEERIGSRGSVDYFQMGSSLPDHLYNLDSKGRATRDPGLGGNTDAKKKKKREKKKKDKDRPGKRWYDK
jgi:hypothetical protein